VLVSAGSLDPTDGGADTVTGGTDDDVIVGGVGGDTIDAGDGSNVVLGDDGEADFVAGALVEAFSTDTATGGDDQVTAGSGGDVVVGGVGADTLTAGDGANVLIGDSATLTFDAGVLVSATSLDATDGGADAITGGTDDDVIVGGVGADTIGAGDGNNVVLGDDGILRWDGPDGDLSTLDTAKTSPSPDGDADGITAGDGNDVILGGAGADTIDAGEGANVVLGDDGEADFVAGALVAAFSTDTATGGDDQVTAGAGRDVVVGGGGADTLTAGDGANVLIGDSATLIFDAGVLVSAVSLDPANGGDDQIAGGAGDDVIVGGVGADTVDAGGGDNVVFGDDGEVDLSGGMLLEVVSTDLDAGAADTITAGAGNDVLVGGPGHDELSADGGVNLVFGGDADLLFGPETGQLVSATSIGPADESGETIAGGAGDDVIFGSAGDDTIDAGDGNNVVLGDLGEVEYAGGVVTRVVSTGDSGGNDRITAGAGRDVVVGGLGDDTIDAGAGNNVVLGDDADVTFDPVTGEIATATSTDTTAGGDDSIATGAGDDVVVGGTGSDTIVDAGGSNVVLGDNAALSSVAGSAHIAATDPVDGAADAITILGDGSNWVMGETGGDAISTGDGDDLVFGDFGELDGALPAQPAVPRTPAAWSFTSIFTRDADTPAGADDTIDAGNGRNVVLGGQGADRIASGSGDDDLIGGNDVAGGEDGGDWIDGGAGDDVIAGDNASVVANGLATSPLDRTLAGSTLYTAVATGGYVADVDPSAGVDPSYGLERTIVLFDGGSTAAPGTFGDDTIAGGAGNDTIFGQNGDDTIQGDGALAAPGTSGTLGTVDAPGSTSGGPGDGMDYVEGGAGADLIFGGLGQDDLVGGSSDLFGYDTAPQRDSDGADAIFGDLGDAASIDDPGDVSANGHSEDADTIAGDNADVFRVVDAAGRYVSFAYDDYAGETQPIVVRAVQLLDGDATGDFLFGESGNDTIYGEGGDDRIYGGGGDDELYGNAGGDWISGGAGDDGILGDNGLLLASRGGLAEPLYGLAATTQATIGADGVALTVNPTGALAYTAVLDAAGAAGNDILYGGLGDDVLHGGGGDDAISGAEALPGYYAYRSIPAGQPLTSFADGRDPLAYLDGALAAYYTPGDVLGYDPATGAFRYFDPANPFEKITVDAQHTIEFLLNFVSATAFDPADFGPGNVQPVVDDGTDTLFGDDGNDWLVGGTGTDFLFGGSGNDLLQADDDLDSTTTTTLGGSAIGYDGICGLATSYSASARDAHGFCADTARLQLVLPWLRSQDVVRAIDGLAEEIERGIGSDYTPDEAATLVRLLQALKPGYDQNANDVVDPRGTAPAFADIADGGGGDDVLIANTASDRLVDRGRGNAFYFPWSGGDDGVVADAGDPDVAWLVYDLALAQGADPAGVELGADDCHLFCTLRPFDENPGLAVAGDSDALGPHGPSGSLTPVVLATPSADLRTMDDLARAYWLDGAARALLELIVVRGQLTPVDQAALGSWSDAALSELAHRGFVAELGAAWVATDAVWRALHLADPPAIGGPRTSTTTEGAGTTLTGTGDPGDTITILDGATSLGTTVAAADGTWSLTVHAAVGVRTLVATETVEELPHAGLTSSASNHVVVTVLPDAPTIASVSTPGPATPRNPATVTVAGTGDAGDTVTVFDGHRAVGSVSVAADGTWSLVVALAAGSHDLTATQSTVCSGRSCSTLTSPASVVASVTVYPPPDTPVVLGTPAAVGNVFALRGRGTAGDTVTVYDGGVAVGSAVVESDGSWSVQLDLAAGAHTLTADQSDPRSGFTSAPSRSVAIAVYDTPPAPSIDSVALGAVWFFSATAAVAGTGVPGDVVTVYDGGRAVGVTTVGSGGAWSISFRLTTGTHSLSAAETGGGGISSARSAATEVDVPWR
jgi:Ca2+-binding RTX toxin-like protein